VYSKLSFIVINKELLYIFRIFKGSTYKS